MCACIFVHMCCHTCVRSHLHAMIIHSVMYVCVFSLLPVGVVRCEIECLCSSAPQSCFHRFSLQHVTICLSTTTCASPSLFQTVTLPSPISHSSLHVRAPPPLSPCLPHSSHLSHHFAVCLSSSLSLGQFCVIKSMVVLLARQLCHPEGQIKN